MAERPGALIIQSDHTILVETAHPLYPEARAGLARFAELAKSPEHPHTYRVTPLSLWNAAAAGVSLDEVRDSLQRHSRYAIPQNVLAEIAEWTSRWGRLRLLPEGPDYRLQASEPI